MTTKGTIAIQISIYAIIVLDFLVLAYFWPRIRTPVLSFVERQVFLSDSRSTVLHFFRRCLVVKDVVTLRVIRQVERIGSRIFHASEAPKPPVVDPPSTAHELSAVSDSLLDCETSVVAFPASIVAKSAPSATETRGAAAFAALSFVHIPR